MANDFSKDPNCVAQYRLENAALTTDSKSTNTLTNNNTVTADTGNYKEGAASAAFVATSSQNLSRLDSDLTSDFPLKNGGSYNDRMSATAWIYANSWNTGGIRIFLSKYDTVSGSYRCLVLRMSESGGFVTLQANFGYASGASSETIDLDASTNYATGTWYHISFIFNIIGQAWTLISYNATADTTYTNTGAITNPLSITVAKFVVGGRQSGTGWTSTWDGNMDEVVIFNDLLTVQEATAIRKGTFTYNPSVGLWLASD